MDIIAVDIGNSHVSLGLFRDDRLQPAKHVPACDSGQLTEALGELRDAQSVGPAGEPLAPVVAGAVNPEALALVECAVEEVLDRKTLLIGRDVPLNIPVALENPDEVGCDRLLTAAAAYDMLQSALVVADFGTAITVDCVSSTGIFMGGAIMPGLRLAARSLHEHTAALPMVTPLVPQTNYGINTETAIQCGIYYGAIGAVQQLIERYSEQLGQWPHVIFTGGDAKMIAQQCDFADSVVPDLCLTGLYLAYVKFRAAGQCHKTP